MSSCDSSTLNSVHGLLFNIKLVLGLVDGIFKVLCIIEKKVSLKTNLRLAFHLFLFDVGLKFTTGMHGLIMLINNKVNILLEENPLDLILLLFILHQLVKFVKYLVNRLNSYLLINILYGPSYKNK